MEGYLPIQAKRARHTPATQGPPTPPECCPQATPHRHFHHRPHHRLHHRRRSRSRSRSSHPPRRCGQTTRQGSTGGYPPGLRQAKQEARCCSIDVRCETHGRSVLTARANTSTAVRTACTSWPSKGSKPAVPVLAAGAAPGTLERGEELTAAGWAAAYVMRFPNSYACALTSRRWASEELGSERRRWEAARSLAAALARPGGIYNRDQHARFMRRCCVCLRLCRRDARACTSRTCGGR